MKCPPPTGACAGSLSGERTFRRFHHIRHDAIAAIKALEDNGRRVPEDCSVIAIDGLPVSEYTIPTLTTMVQPAEEMGMESVSILLKMLEGAPARHLLLEARIREGASIKQV